MYNKSLENSNINTQLRRIPVAIVGMASIFPQSRNVQEYWEKIVNKVDCITDVPSSYWDVEAYYDPDPKARDKTYCKKGGFIPEIEFNPMEFGLPPNLLEATDTSQLLSLVVAKQAIEDAGYGQERQLNRERVGIILGAAAGKPLSMPLSARIQYPIWEKVLKSSGLSEEDTQKIIEKIKSAYVEWEENSFPGLLSNVITGRIANRLDLGGTNCTVDAACASSLAALKMAISELVEHRCDMMITGGVDTDNSIMTYLCFSKTPALSRKQQSRPFDIDADGMIVGEGIGMVVLKRLEDAERDNDKIYAVIKGLGTSSDGRYKSIYAPRAEGQVKALQRAYEDAGVSPASVGLVEAHGTGTMAGDPAEFTALKQFFGENTSKTQHIALGSIKSQIGHTKAAAGAASLIKTALALHHKILPPTINITKPNPKLNIETSPFYLNTETRPWLHADGETPRRAGVSSFGFGGTNYHVVLEEYQGKHNQAYRLHNTPSPVLLHAPTPIQLLVQCQDVLHQLQSDAGERHFAQLIDQSKSLEIPVTSARVGFVADSLKEACNLLQATISMLNNQQSSSWEHPQGIYYRQSGMALEGKVVALFSGQGSQYLEMGRELAINFPSLHQAYTHMDSLLTKDDLKPLSEIVFPAPVFDDAQKDAQVKALQRTEYAQPAIGVFSVGLYKILQQAGFKPDVVAGHSFGELTALWAAGVFSDEDYFFLVKARGQAMATPDNPNIDAGTMLAVTGDVTHVEAIIKNFPKVTIANFNSNRQVVLAGFKSELAKVQQTLTDLGYSTVWLPVSAAFHTPLVAHAQKPFAQAVESVAFNRAKIPVYTNVTGKSYPSEPQAIQNNLKEHLSSSVLFKQEIENIYNAGGSCFVEFGPRSILSNLVKDSLGDRPHLTVALNGSRQKDSDRQLREAVVQLRVAGLALKNLDPYQQSQKIPSVQKAKGLTFRLNGANYVSEKTRMAFEEALQDGHQVKLSAAQQPKEISVTSSVSLIATTSTVPVSPEPIASEKSTATQPEGDLITHSTSSVAVARSVTVTSEPIPTQPIPETPMSYQRVLDSLEYCLAQFNQHQSETLHIHGQYLNHQMEYAKLFFHLMHEQNELFFNSNNTHQSAQTRSSALESLERNLMRFHDHQAGTLHAHEQSINHQAEYAKNFFQLIQQQYNLLITGNSTHNGLEQTQAAVNVANTQDHSVALPIEKPVLISEPVIHPEPVATNGYKLAQDNSVAQEDHSDSAATVTSTPPVAPDPQPVASNGNGSKSHLEIPAALAFTAPVAPSPQPVVSNGNRSKSHLETLAAPAISAPVAPSPQPVASNGNGNKPLPATSVTVAKHTETVAVTVTPPDSLESNPLTQMLLAVVSQKTGYPAEMLELDMDMEADLGIDSIKRVEIFGALQDQFPDAPKANTEELTELRTLGQIISYMWSLAPQTPSAPPTPISPTPEVRKLEQETQLTTRIETSSERVSTSNANGTQLVQESVEIIAQTVATATFVPTPSDSLESNPLTKILLAVVSQKTGYPAEMLELDMDMEADLGIDSIKRVEIFGALQDQFPDAPKTSTEELTELRTLGQIISYMQQQAKAAEKKSLEMRQPVSSRA
ncbi:type I polyketide synthase [Brasilonema sp. UFV-L1]|uniref:type I polyketide synthase n=1 Tax=Brasilonema sp. UFV-L1 TaxID=2234130 RepID=UPI00145FA746|nr:polyketide synthase [Brasilonema sp. UFV-L1]